ncbi:MAG: 3-keto-5-aminohexanoate cleavage protein [Alphaproteobacteria bacterium]|nr:3-keto-5-aminohexanoate cleavage protein [Alphaproteobacteria bacterium]
MQKTIITCAVTGSLTKPEQSPHIPITPEQIAASAIDAAKAGAAVAHIHVRDPETGRPSMAFELYEEVVDRIRASDTDLVINLTTGPGGRFVPSDHDPKVPAPATNIKSAAERVEHVVRLKPEICTLDLNTMWFGEGVVMNTPKMATAMAGMIREAGVLPELEVFDSGDIRLAKDMLKDGVLAAPALFQMVMGIRYGFAGDVETLLYAVNQLPTESRRPGAARWAAMGISRMSLPTVAMASMLGGHVRVGLEDNLYIRKGELAPSNAALVERAVQILDLLGASPATPSEAREILGLKTP